MQLVDAFEIKDFASIEMEAIFNNCELIFLDQTFLKFSFDNKIILFSKNKVFFLFSQSSFDLFLC